MGVAYRYVEGANLIVTIWDGRVTSGEWTDLACRQADDPAFLRARRRLIDARAADLSITNDAALAISAVSQPADATVGVVRLAIVTNFSRQIAGQVDDRRARGVTTIVFNNIDTAAAWLGVDVDIVSTAIRNLREGR